MKDKKFLRIVTEAIKGDSQSFNELMKLRSRNILYIAMSIVHDKDMGEDIAQEAAASMQRDISNLKSPQAFDSWMYRIVYNACLNEKRKMSRVQLQKIDALPEGTFVEDRRDFLPEDFVTNAEKRTELLHAIQELPETYRMSVLLFYYEEMGYQEIADVMDVRVQDVAYYLRMAKGKLRQQLIAGSIDADFTLSESSAGSGVKQVNQVTNSTVAKNAGFLGAAPIITQVLVADEKATITNTMVERLVTSVGVSAAAGTGVAVAGSAMSIGAISVFSTVGDALKGIGIIKIAAPILCVAAVATGVYLVNNNEVEDQTQLFIEQNDALKDENNQAELSDQTPTKEELMEEVGLSEIQVEQLETYFTKGETQEVWEEYVEETQLTFMGSTIERIAGNTYTYSAYVFDDPAANKLLISIEQKDDSGNVNIVYRTATSSSEVPQQREIKEAFYAWNQ